MTISVVIPAYNEEEYIGQTLKSVLQNTDSNLLEIVVVNNASTDKTAEVAAAFPKVRIANEPQKGLTRARQAGLIAAQGEILAYIDADTRVPAHWFENINKEFSRDPGLVCLSGPYEYYDLSKFKLALVKVWNWFAIQIPKFKGAYVIMGGNFAAKKQALVLAGGFNPEITFYGEDTDIARRLSAVGEVKFLQSYYILTSARRLNSEGFISVGFKYLVNYFSVVFLKKPAMKKYKDIR
jgi:glycosyltransferase involved in cell wall biosynthesis